MLRRGREGKEPDIVKAAGLELNLLKGTVSVCGNMVELTRNEVQILVCLMSRAGEIVSRMDLIEALWESQIYIDDNTLSVNMTRLRGKLAELGKPDCIKTRRGWGTNYNKRCLGKDTALICSCKFKENISIPYLGDMIWHEML